MEHLSLGYREVDVRFLMAEYSKHLNLIKWARRASGKRNSRVRYIAYLLILLSVILGYFAVYPLIIVPIALSTSVIFISARRQWLKNNPPAMPVNPLVDGIYLFVLHLLINFSAFALGFFFHYSVGFQS